MNRMHRSQRPASLPVTFPTLRWVAMAILLLFTVERGNAQLENGKRAASREIKVPYALSWGDSPDKVREMLNAVKARETGLLEKSPGRLELSAEGLGVGDLLLKKSLFSFKDGSLVEVELQYSNSSWDAETALDFFERTRRRIDERYNPGTLLVNKLKEHPAGEKIPKEMTYTLIIYRWSQPAASLELNFYGVEEKDQAYRLVSLHYKAPA